MKRFALVLFPAMVALGCDKAESTYKGGPVPLSPTSMPSPPASAPTGASAPATVGADGSVKLTGENSAVGFVGTKPNGKHEGGFKTLEGTIATSATGISSLNVTFDVDSMYTDAPGLTNHLKSPDFFEVKQHPKATFASTKVEAVAGKADEFTITGDLTLHGVKKSIAFPAKVSNDKGNFTLTSSFKIQWKDYGMNYAKPGIDPDVTVTVSVGKAK